MLNESYLKSTDLKVKCILVASSINDIQKLEQQFNEEDIYLECIQDSAKEPYSISASQLFAWGKN